MSIVNAALPFPAIGRDAVAHDIAALFAQLTGTVSSCRERPALSNGAERPFPPVPETGGKKSSSMIVKAEGDHAGVE